MSFIAIALSIRPLWAVFYFHHSKPFQPGANALIVTSEENVFINTLHFFADKRHFPYIDEINFSPEKAVTILPIVTPLVTSEYGSCPDACLALI